MDSPEVVLIEHPFPRKGARFGEVVRSADLDMDGDLDLLIGAPGQGVVYVAFRTGSDQEPCWTVERALGAHGPADLNVDATARNGFGAAFEVAELDGDPEPELLVGAHMEFQGVGAVYLFGVGKPLLAEPVVITAPSPGAFGSSVALGDLDADGVMDLAISAPHALVDGIDAGAVWIYSGPLDEFPTPSLELTNPGPVADGNFGHVLVVGEPGPGQPSRLFVSAPGNRNNNAESSAGQVFEFPVPVESDLYHVAEEAQGSPSDKPRFGMDICSGGGFLLVGAPRRDLGTTLDAGLGFVFDPSLAGMTEHSRQDAEPKDLFGYRVGIGNLTGDASLDFLFVALLPRRMFLWDGANRQGAYRELVPLEDAGDHFAMGLHIVDLIDDSYEELVMGDPTWDRPHKSIYDDAGRVVVQQVKAE